MPANRRRSISPPSLVRPVVAPTGSRMFTAPPDRGQQGIFVSPPPGFVVATTSGSEWIVYAALAKVLKKPDDPTKPPYIGYPGLWEYQMPFLQGRHQHGGAVVDYVVYGGSRYAEDATLIRLQTEQFHYFTDYAKQESDREQMTRLLAIANTIDIDEIEILGDPSGYKPCRVIAEALSGFNLPNPLGSNTARRARGLWRPS